MKNRFIGNVNSTFNKELLNNLKIENINIVSFIDLDFDIDIEELKKDKELIILFPVLDDQNLFNHMSIAWKLMIESAFYDWGGCATSIFIVYPNCEGTTPIEVGHIIDNLDYQSLVDNIWIWPRFDKDFQLRDESIENLSFQRFKNAIQFQQVAL